MEEFTAAQYNRSQGAMLGAVNAKLPGGLEEATKRLVVLNDRMAEADYSLRRLVEQMFGPAPEQPCGPEAPYGTSLVSEIVRLETRMTDIAALIAKL